VEQPGKSGPVFRVIHTEGNADNETNNDDPDDYIHGGHSLPPHH
jgi:hypothetical protein